MFLGFWHRGNCVNTTVFARCRPQNTVNTVVFATRSKKHRKYCGFGLARRKKSRYLRCFFFAPRRFKKREDTTELTILGCKNERFFALEMPVKNMQQQQQQKQQQQQQQQQ